MYWVYFTRNLPGKHFLMMWKYSWKTPKSCFLNTSKKSSREDKIKILRLIIWNWCPESISGREAFIKKNFSPCFFKQFFTLNHPIVSFWVLFSHCFKWTKILKNVCSEFSTFSPWTTYFYCLKFYLVIILSEQKFEKKTLMPISDCFTLWCTYFDY